MFSMCQLIQTFPLSERNLLWDYSSDQQFKLCPELVSNSASLFSIKEWKHMRVFYFSNMCVFGCVYAWVLVLLPWYKKLFKKKQKKGEVRARWGRERETERTNEQDVSPRRDAVQGGVSQAIWVRIALYDWPQLASEELKRLRLETSVDHPEINRPSTAI